VGPNQTIAVGPLRVDKLTSYRTVKGILVAGTEDEPLGDAEDVADAGTGAPAHLHGPEGLFGIGEAS